jgi:4-hydroxybenzoate polyprenyltransferase
MLAAALSAGSSQIVLMLLLPVAAQFAWQIGLTNFDSASDCLAKFKSNRWAGLGVFAALVGARVLA